MTNTHNSHRKIRAFHFETTIGLVPADAAAWVTSVDGATGFQIAVEEMEPTFVRGREAVPNADIQARVFKSQAPHLGLPTADGGAITSRMWGSLSSWSEGVQVTQTSLGRLLEHALGASEQGNHTAVDTGGVTSTTEITVVTATNLAVGQIIGIAAAADPARIFPVQITALAGNDITYDRILPFTVNDGDKIYGAENTRPDQAALTNQGDAGSSTLSIYYQDGPDIWMTGGSHLSLPTIVTERGQQPKLTWEILAARGYPTGDGAPAEAAFTSAIEGETSDVQPVGRDTQVRLEDFGDTAEGCINVFSVATTVGVPVLPQDSVTECDIGSPGRIGYRTEPADTIFEVVVPLDVSQQTRWVAGTELTFTYFQIAPVGSGWCIHAPRVVLMESPEPASEGTNQYIVRLKALENDAATTEMAKSKTVIARY
jgi:hypothetical protein